MKAKIKTLTTRSEPSDYALGELFHSAKGNLHFAVQCAQGGREYVAVIDGYLETTKSISRPCRPAPVGTTITLGA